MAEKVKISISPAVAVFVRPGVSSDNKLKGVDAAAVLGADRVVLLFCLMKDHDPVVQAAASCAFDMLAEACLLEYVSLAEPHPSILDAIARSHYTSSVLVSALLNCPMLHKQTAEFLKDVLNNETDLMQESCSMVESGDSVDGVGNEEAEAITDVMASAGDAGIETEELADGDYLSKYQMVQVMGIGEKIKMALSGDKEWRSLLVKDANKLVSGSVIKNPRITDGEILTIVKVGVQNDEIIRLICANKEWIKNYAIRKALLENPKTPLPNALRYLATMNDKDISSYAKSKNISTTISTQAKRMALAKKR